ncbi:transporter substrate-binding domain-containing protein [Maribacter sp. 1_MG-2023]|uniref:transporter substrate-binding domain-containing protein n=1 Tax=Maribacter sp. 1_MG-2023 TaxID=3062677 RepID=UPI0026E32FAF|nr:transporter substrate-binding domain-containing protein [Maribacter sp. 1_MG-2023]MDO6470200.1 transporter substrate-binding domain-containing protein [Maribacter sp. 1_MG-2023]
MLKTYNYLLNSFLLLITTSLTISCGPKIVKHSDSFTDSKTSTLKTIKDRDTLRVGTTGDFMPFSYKIDSNKIYAGLDIEMAKTLAKSLDVEVAFIETSWPTLMEDLRNGKFDIGMSGITITPERQTKAFFSIPVLSSGKAAITRDENSLNYNSIEKINKQNVRVIFNPGGTNEAFARANFPKARLILNDNNLDIFQKLVDGEADVMVTDAVETLMQEQIHKELEAVNPNQPFNFFDFGYLIEKDAVFKTVIDNWLLSQQKDSVVFKLLKKEIINLN